MRLCFLMLFVTTTLMANEAIPYRLKGQGNFYHDFETMNVEKWLDKKEWVKSLKFNKHQKRAQIEHNYREEVARVMTCIGRCQLLRGEASYDLSYRSLILEGDTIETARDSVLWVTLKNGNMLRLSALTKLQIPEVNLAHKRAHFTMVLVHGFIHHIDREDDPAFYDEGLMDTETIIFPLRYKIANLEYFYWRKHRKLEKKVRTREELFSHYRGEKSLADQFILGDFNREYFIHTPHGDIMIKNASFMMSFQANSGVFWRHGLREGTVQPAIVQLRKAKAFEENLASGRWHVIYNGSITERPSLEQEFLGEKYLVERGVALRLVRDHFFNKYFYKLFRALHIKDRKATAKQGSRTWSSKEMASRIQYLKDYYHFMGRRWIQHYEDLETKWAHIPIEHYNKAALKDVVAHLQELKQRDFPIMKEYNKTQFHFWLWHRTKGPWFPKNVLKD